MKWGLLASIIYILAPAHGSLGQTAGELNSMFGKSRYYEVSNRILMGAKFAGDGQICFASMQPDRMVGKDAVSNNQLFMHISEVDRVFDRLAPESSRGPQISASRETFGNGSILSVIQNYQDVSLTLYYGKNAKQEDEDAIVAATIVWKNRTCKSD